MTETAFITQYRDEAIMGFEVNASLLRETVTNEAVIKGNTATFLVADSGGRSAVTRGVDSLIPSRPDDNTQTSATLQEWHDLVDKTNFNIFASQGNQKAIMQKTTMGVINRKIDSDIIAQLDTATVNTGPAAKGDVKMFMKARTILVNSSVPWDSNITLLASSAFLSYLLMAPEFSNAEYVDIKPMASGSPDWRDKPPAYRWRNCLLIEHPSLTGAGTATEDCYLFHKSAIGHATNKSGMDVDLGYDGRQAASWCRVSLDMGSALLQNAGIVNINHDGAEFVAA